ncbi:hypothetical protein TPY_1958 [Sulfobacillus acidophilus TPY]|nr:hypothetical protein TPY_1958 [Sulfobacillus acidophilus TPY]
MNCPTALCFGGHYLVFRDWLEARDQKYFLQSNGIALTGACPRGVVWNHSIRANGHSRIFSLRIVGLSV